MRNLINRREYIDKLLSYKDKEIIKVVTGLRRSGKSIVPKGFLAHLAMVATGTARGVLFAKTESTLFSKFIVPTLNVSEMIAEDAIFDLIEE